MTNKEQYSRFCQTTYVPIFSKPWWLDAICLPENWDVWLYKKGTSVLAAMPYYLEQRGPYRYVTKPLLTQNNGIIFHADATAKLSSLAAFQEEVINAANDFIESMSLDVYEQQYHYSFVNWLPFFWHRYTAITRYTYVIDHTDDIDAVWENISSNYRNHIKKGYRSAAAIKTDVDRDIFWEQHKKVFEKQGLPCPFSYELWTRLYEACKANHAGKTMCAEDASGNVLCILYLVWDEQSVYQLLGGSMPEFQHLQAYNMLTWEGIKFALSSGRQYDFEGSVIKRISRSMREFGGTPMPYFRIRKVFNPAIVRKEAEDYIMSITIPPRSANDAVAAAPIVFAAFAAGRENRRAA